MSDQIQAQNQTTSPPDGEITGAQSLLKTMVACGIDACFANPGTSELHLVSALQTDDRVTSVLCLFEGVATGAADGYGRMRGTPAATLLHLGPGLANGWANLHNARKAKTPLINLVGEHATWHRHYDASLSSDLEGLSGTISAWSKISKAPAEVGADVVEAYRAAMAPYYLATYLTNFIFKTKYERVIFNRIK